ncbi:ABC transporter permease subunit [Terriglobus sp. YAF25]
MIAIIVATDQLLWRPLIAWSDKFKFEQTESSNRVSSPLLHLLQHSTAIRHLRQRTLRPVSELFYRTSYKRRAAHHQQPASDSTLQKVLRYVAAGLVIGIVLFAATHAIVLLREVQPRQIGMIFLGAGATFLRVLAALLIGSAWTIPAGVAIGLHPRLARIAQPLAQIAASVPATAVFPVLLVGIVKAGGGLGIGSIALMLLGTQWYILFNVIAGAIAIPSDLREVGRLFRFSTVEKWKVIILPSIFPYLITGLVTASGGAWNASIVAEYFRLKNQTLSTFGLGAQISAATDAGQFPVLLWATIVMALIVVTINRLLWRPIYRIAETRYKLSA